MEKKHILVNPTDKSQSLLCFLAIHRSQEISQGESKLKFSWKLYHLIHYFFHELFLCRTTILEILKAKSYFYMLSDIEY